MWVSHVAVCNCVAVHLQLEHNRLVAMSAGNEALCAQRSELQGVLEGYGELPASVVCALFPCADPCWVLLPLCRQPWRCGRCAMHGCIQLTHDCWGHMNRRSCSPSLACIIPCFLRQHQQSTSLSCLDLHACTISNDCAASVLSNSVHACVCFHGRWGRSCACSRCSGRWME